MSVKLFWIVLLHSTLRFSDPELPAVLAKIKAKDGPDPIPQVLIERHKLTPEEAILWERHLAQIWMALEADYAMSGESQELSAAISDLVANPDIRVYWQHATSGGGWHTCNSGFSEYVDRLRRNNSSQ